MKFARFIGFIVAVTAIAAILMLPGGLCLQYTIDFWMPYVVHHAVHVPLVPCMIGSVVLAGLPIPMAIITFIASYVI